jgi:CubicO group peptidase (beta-lactamase class C family)
MKNNVGWFRSTHCKMNRREFVASLIGSAAAITSALATAARNPAVPETPAREDLDEMLTSIRKEFSLPALAAGAVKQGRVVAAGAVGIRKVGEPAAVTWKDKFHIGSCTKAMTATLAATAIDEGKLKWVSPLAEVFPERRDKMDPAFREVTLEVLLTHRSGLAHDGTSYGRANTTITEKRLAYMDAVISKPPAHEPGAFNYSNAGYIIVGAMLERVMGKAWEQLMHERLFKPLNMRSAGFGVAAKERKTDQPWGHVWRVDKFVPRYGDNPPALGPAGTVHCSIRDYLKFASLHASLGARPSGIITRNSCEILHQPAKDNYAKGWGVVERTWARGAALTHAGSNTMNYFVVWVAPKIDFALAVATNAAGEKVPAALDRVAGNLVKKFCT